ncbi:TetR/AcrR family transcriptional regulator [Rathayibacter sp. VKM Ac-2835]|uniref:TetR/AcrR family transcriptional regulator n=1 Tax=Rathayibacter sp. VKM Ac-2835 TaxID=2739043 RepID=UPI001565CBEC|nr:TetR family transcriptional regulator [Rathayibacter sp. VKM Ac-2835]NRG41039.1 TetR/AcrR family transcriptional regulator [Rathayibacter sp. VKM Ac-2835]
MPSTAPRGGAGRPERRPAPERGNVRGAATRQLILDAAERLFAERGITAVPLRDIGVAAGQRNHAAVQYHFGDRDELVKAIMESRGAESETQRTRVVASLAAGGRTPEITDVVSAFVRPLALHIRPENHYLAFLSLLITEAGGYEGLGGADIHAGASVLTLGALLEQLLPELPAELLAERWELAMTSSVHALARYQSALQRRGRMRAGIDELLEDLVAFLSAGIVAPARR